MGRPRRPQHVRPWLEVCDGATVVTLPLPPPLPPDQLAPDAAPDRGRSWQDEPTVEIWLHEHAAVLRLSEESHDDVVVDRLVGDVVEALGRQPDLGRLGPGSVALEAISAVLRLGREHLEDIEEGLDDAEAIVFSRSTADPSEAIYVLARQVAELRRIVLGLDIPLERLEHETLPGIDPALHPRFVDAGHGLDRLVVQLDGYGDALGNALQSHLGKVAARQNEDMRTISSWAAIAAVPTAVAGIYGMNFHQNMPLLESPYGFAVIMVLMAVACAGLYVRLRAAGWL
jgi:magnesium transporter